MDVGTKVNISSPSIHKLYGIKPDDEFEITSVNPYKVANLNNGWSIELKHLKPIVENKNENNYNDINISDLSDLIDEYIANLIEEDKSFTAYDVTKGLREENPNLNIHHQSVKQIIHETMQSVPGYMKELVEVGSPIQPWLYFPEGYDPSTYKTGQGPQVLELKDEDVIDFRDDPVPVAVPVKGPGIVRRFLSKFGL